MQDRIYNAIRNHGGIATSEFKPRSNLNEQKYDFWKEYDPQGDWKGKIDIYMHEPKKIAIEVCGVDDLYAKVLQKVLTIKKLFPEINQIDIFEYDYLDKNSEAGKQFKLWVGREAKDYTEIQSFVLEKWLKESCLPENVEVKFKSEKDLEKLENEGLSALL
jgi:hypothetical protein